MGSRKRRKNYLVDRIKRLIEEFEAKYLSVRCIKEGNWNMFREALIETMKSGAINKRIFMDYCSVGYTSILYEMRNSIMEIKSSFFATPHSVTSSILLTK